MVVQKTSFIKIPIKNIGTFYESTTNQEDKTVL